MKKVGLSYGIIASDADFFKFAVKFNLLLVATMIALWAIILGGEGRPEFINFDNFEVSKVTFGEAMGVLALMMASAYWSQSASCLVSVCLGSFERIQAEMAMIYGSLTLAVFLMNLLGVWGIIWLPVCPPILLFGFEFAKTRFWFNNAKESHQDLED